MPHFRLPDGDLYYEASGAGPNLLLLAGVGTDLASWVFQTQGLADAARVVAVDHRGVGRSTSPGLPSTEAMADDAAALLQDLGPAVVLGHSMGGFVAQHLALRHPDLVRGLVLACTSAHLDAFAMTLLEVWQAQKEAGLPRDTFARGFFPWVFSRAFFEDRLTVAAAVRLYVENPWPQAPEDLARQVAACRAHDTRNRLREIRVPTLVLAAEADAVAPPAQGRELAAGIAGARFTEFPGAGHAAMNEVPDAFNAEVREFLAGLPEATPAGTRSPPA